MGVAQHDPDAVRVDKWLWSVRLYPSRTAATDACIAGLVKVGGERAKPSRTIRAGDEIRLSLHPRVVTCRVVRTIAQRVGAPVAVECYEVVEEVRRPDEVPWWDEVGRRDRGAGRPTKRERRQIDDLHGRSRDG